MLNPSLLFLVFFTAWESLFNENVNKSFNKPKLKKNINKFQLGFRIKKMELQKASKPMWKCWKGRVVKGLHPTAARNQVKDKIAGIKR